MTQETLKGILLNEHTELSMSDLCCACNRSAEWIIELVEVGALEPINYRQTQWMFSANSLQKVQTAMRLQRDLEINLAGVALALELLEEIDSLKSQLGRFE